MIDIRLLASDDIIYYIIAFSSNFQPPAISAARNVREHISRAFTYAAYHAFAQQFHGRSAPVSELMIRY